MATENDKVILCI